MTGGSKLRAQFAIVVDLAVEDQREGSALLRIPGPQYHGLTPRCGKIDDGEAPVSEASSRLVRNIDPQRTLAVRTSMRHTVGHALQQVCGEITLHSDDTAHLANAPDAQDRCA